jgi:glycosyltransferase involved in cell wall biosynthesis
LLFPIDWAEPFGLVMIEAMACGTPAIARACGSVPEVLKDGIMGLIAPDAQGLAEAGKKVEQLPRQLVRLEFEKRFSAAAMAMRYEQSYYALMERAHCLPVARQRQVESTNPAFGSSDSVEAPA